MRAAICRDFGKPFEIGEIELAPPGPGEVRAEVRAAAICHSDVIAADGGWGGVLPAVYGHEAAGVVTEVGEGVEGLAPGDRVVLTLVRHCGTCPCCRRNLRGSCETPPDMGGRQLLRMPDGTPVTQGLRAAAFAEEVLVHRSQVVAIGDGIDFAPASLLACGVITGFGAVANTAALTPGSDVAVIGAGGVGLNSVQGAALTGARRVIAVDLAAEKLEAARSFGATDAVDGAAHDPVEEVLRLTGGRGVDFAFVTVGAPRAMEQSYRMLAKGGASVLVGMGAEGITSTFDPLTLSDSSQRILGSKMGHCDIQREIPRLADLYRAGKLKLDELISERFPFEEINTAMDRVRAGQGLRNVVMMGEAS